MKIELTIPDEYLEALHYTVLHNEFNPPPRRGMTDAEMASEVTKLVSDAVLSACGEMRQRMHAEQRSALTDLVGVLHKHALADAIKLLADLPTRFDK